MEVLRQSRIDCCCTIILKSGYVKNLVIRTRVGYEKIWNLVRTN